MTNNFQPSKELIELISQPLHEILIQNGAEIDPDKSSKNNIVLKDINGDKLVISKKDNTFKNDKNKTINYESYLYFNVNNDMDRGNILNYVKNRGIKLNDLINNYDANKAQEFKINLTSKKNSIHNFMEYENKFNQMKENNLLVNPMFKRRGFSEETLKAYQGFIKADTRDNAIIPQYVFIDKETKIEQEIYIINHNKHIEWNKIPAETQKNKTIEDLKSNPQELKDEITYLVNKKHKNHLAICGYTARLTWAITENSNGTKKEKPLKQLSYGSKGLEILNINKNKNEIQDIVISESILDSMSCIELLGMNPNTTTLVSLGGNYSKDGIIEKTLSFIIDEAPNALLTLAFDNDEKGKEYTESIKKLIQIKHKDREIDLIYEPFTKDCNDDLKLSKITNNAINEESYDKWVKTNIETYGKTRNANQRQHILSALRKADNIKSIGENNKELFNQMDKHKAVKNFKTK